MAQKAVSSAGAASARLMVYKSNHQGLVGGVVIFLCLCKLSPQALKNLSTVIKIHNYS